MLSAHTPPPHVSNQRKWRPVALTYIISLLALGGLGAGLYPTTAAWISSYNQSKVLSEAQTGLENITPGTDAQLKAARKYNEALTAGVKLEPGGNVPLGAGNLSGTELIYSDMLKASEEGLMGRIKVPSIDVDLPIYHGTSEETLLRGAGHLEGSHLPVGGESTRSVITAHRGLANSTMFTNLNRVTEGETFTLEVLGEVLVYRVFDIQVIDPDDSGALQAIPGEDVVTLITCTPLGINTQRILVSGTRITPTPPKELAEAGSTPNPYGFPWWIVIGSAGVLSVGTYFIRRGYMDARVSSSRQSNNSRDQAGEQRHDIALG